MYLASGTQTASPIDHYVRLHRALQEKKLSFTIKDTVDRDFCIGCGACAFASEGVIPIQLDENGMYSAILTDVSNDLLERVDKFCPFSDAADNEDVLAEKLFGSEMNKHGFLGRYLNTYAGRVSSTPYIKGSSSGGLTSWLLRELLNYKVVDAVIDVADAQMMPGELFSYQATEEGGLASTRKSKYYSTTMSEALAKIRDDDRRFAVVGVPCYIKAVRLLADQDPIIRDRVKVYVGLVCGHMKSQFFGESLAWQLGIAPADLATVDFRIKNPDRAASDYDFGARAKVNNEWRKRRTGDLVGGNWGHAAFQPEACNFCDDIFAETADVSFGDAWLPQYTDDWRGTNIVISREASIDEILERGKESGVIALESVGAEEIAKSQAGNFRHRRVGLAVRLADDIELGLRVPKKRVDPGYEDVDGKRLKIIRMRRQLSQLSFAAYRSAKKEHDLNIYLQIMEEGIRQYRLLETSPFWRRAASKIKRSAIHLRQEARQSMASVKRKLG